MTTRDRSPPVLTILLGVLALAAAGIAAYAVWMLAQLIGVFRRD